MGPDEGVAQPTIYERGMASYYAKSFSGQLTANGDTYDPNEMTAAHKSLPLGSQVRVTNTDNGRSVKVEINDRGPYAAGRVIDLSRRAADKLDMHHLGVVPVKIEVLSDSDNDDAVQD